MKPSQTFPKSHLHSIFHSSQWLCLYFCVSFHRPASDCFSVAQEMPIKLHENVNSCALIVVTLGFPLSVGVLVFVRLWVIFYLILRPCRREGWSRDSSSRTARTKRTTWLVSHNISAPGPQQSTPPLSCIASYVSLNSNTHLLPWGCSFSKLIILFQSGEINRYFTLATVMGVISHHISHCKLGVSLWIEPFLPFKICLAGSNYRLQISSEVLPEAVLGQLCLINYQRCCPVFSQLNTLHSRGFMLPLCVRCSYAQMLK